MNGGAQYLLTLTNNCTAGQALEFTVQGMASGVSTRSSAPVYILSASTPDFTVTSGGSAPAVLAFQSSVSFPVRRVVRSPGPEVWTAVVWNRI